MTRTPHHERVCLMLRLLKSGALVTVGLVLGGTVIAGAVDPTTTDPVTLCLSKALVRVAADDTCTAKET